MAERKSPQAVAAILRQTLAQEQRKSSFLSLLPSVSALGGYTATNNQLYAPILDNSENAAVDVRYDAFPFSPNWYGQEQAQALARAASYSGVQTRQDVTLSVESLYFSILQEQDAAESIDRVEKRLENLRLSVIPRYTMGRAPPFDLVQVKSSVADLARLRDTYAVQLKSNEVRLALILGLPLNQDLRLKALSVLPPIPLPASQGVEQSPALAALEQESAVARLGVKQARSARFPQLVYDFQYGYGGPTIHDTVLGYVSSIGLRLNIFDWGQISSQVKQKRTSLALADAALEEKRQTIAAQAVQARAQAEADLAQMRRLEDLLPQAQDSARTAAARYRRGAMSVLEATGAAQLWLNALLGERAAYYSYLQDLATLQDLTGQGGPESARIYE